MRDTVYTPDKWVILKISGEDPHYKVFGGWSSSYLYGGSWRMNSGIVGHSFDGDYWYFDGYSGSQYECYVDSYGFTTESSQVMAQLESKYGSKVSVVEDQAWVSEDWDWILTNG